MRFLASLYNEKGRALLDKEEYQEAEKEFRRATNLAPNWSVPWFNLGLLYKQQRQWAASLACNQHATQLQPTDKDAWWNLGIAATAVRNWEEARRAWTSYGIELSAGEGPIEMNLGSTPIRLNPRTHGEVVWCLRIDPARAVVNSVPLPTSKHAFGDMVLHDGAPNGYREREGREVPIFDELELLELSEYGTYEAKLALNSSEDIEVLTELAGQRKLAVEDWATLGSLCKSCSEGRPHDRHEIEPVPIDRPVRMALAAPSEQSARSLFDAWGGERAGCRLMELECVFSR